MKLLMNVYYRIILMGNVSGFRKDSAAIFPPPESIQPYHVVTLRYNIAPFASIPIIYLNILLNIIFIVIMYVFYQRLYPASGNTPTCHLHLCDRTAEFPVLNKLHPIRSSVSWTQYHINWYNPCILIHIICRFHKGTTVESLATGILGIYLSDLFNKTYSHVACLELLLVSSIWGKHGSCVHSNKFSLIPPRNIWTLLIKLKINPEPLWSLELQMKFAKLSMVRTPGYPMSWKR